MAYLSSFKNDIFISYARLNDEPPPDGLKGWVSQFYDQLKYELGQRFERGGDVEIWRDTHAMDGSVFFDDAIPENVRESGIFLALVSRAYLSSRSYCPKELSCFYRKVKDEPYALEVNHRSRIITVLLQNIPPDDWLPELKGTAGFHLNDSVGTNNDGRFTDPNSPTFKQQLRPLVDALSTTLRTLGPLTTAIPKETEAPPKTFSLFLAHTEGPLATETRNRIWEELWLKEVDIITNIPPPDDPDMHEKAVRDGMRKASLSVHLLDDAAGRKIPPKKGEDAPETTYYRKQVELGAETSKPQLIYVPEGLDFDSVEDEAHRKFLQSLETGDRDRSSYKFIRKTQPVLIAEEILQEIERIKTGTGPPAQPRTALLDIHEKDYQGAYDFKLQPVLRERRLGIAVNPTGDGPQQSTAIFDSVRKLVKVLIIVLGHVTERWASSRLNSTLKEAGASLEFCGIYVPETRPIDFAAFQSPPDKSVPITFFFTPEELSGLLKKYLKD